MPTSLLFLAVVLIWGTTWYAILYQLAAAAPEVAVAVRFALAATLILGGCALRGVPLRFGPRLHGLFALQGVVGYCIGYVAVYYAEQYVVTGLVAVGYATSPLLNLLAMRLLFGAPWSRRVAVGGLLGLLGVVLVFWPQFDAQFHGAAWGGEVARRTAIGAAWTALGVLSSLVAVMAVVKIGSAGVRGWAPLGWAMAWSVPATLALAVVLGRSFDIAWSPAYGASLLYLAVAGSALAFGAYYRLVERVGAARAGYVGVMVPVVALVVSTVLEGFTWSLVSAIGVAVAVIGNVLTLATTPSRAPAADAMAGSSTDGTATLPPAAVPVSPARAAGR